MELKLGTQVPDWARDRAAGRFEGDEEEIQVPRLQQVQKTSSLVDEGRAKLADLFSEPHGTVVGSDSIRVCFVILHLKRCYKYFRDNRLVWSYDRKEDCLKETYFSKEDKQKLSPILVFDPSRAEKDQDHSWKFRTWDYAVVGPVGWMLDDKFSPEPPGEISLQKGFTVEPMVVSFSSTSSENGRKLWNSLKGVKLHSQVVEFWTSKEKNDKDQSYSVLHGRRVFTLQDKKQVEAFAGQVTESAALLERGNQAQLPAQVGGGEGEDDVPF